MNNYNTNKSKTETSIIVARGLVRIFDASNTVARGLVSIFDASDTVARGLASVRAPCQKLDNKRISVFMCFSHSYMFIQINRKSPLFSFKGRISKVEKSRYLALAPDCSGNPFSFSSKEKDWNGKRG